MQSNFTPRRLCLLLFLLSILTRSFGQDGTLDTQFGTGGRTWEQPVSYPISTTNPGTVARVLVQPDGKIIHISPTGSVGMILTRYLPDGAVDATFGNGGRIEYSDVQTVYQPRDAVMLPSGKFLVAGEYRVNPVGAEHGFAVIRFNADGTLDAGFNGTGRSVIPLASSNPVARGIMVQPDGKIVVVGSAPGLYTIVRMNSDGSADTSFDSDGVVKLSFNNGSESAYAAALTADGKLVVAGEAMNTVVIQGFTYYRLDLGILRLLPDGSLDGSFGAGGKVTFSTPEAKDFARNIHIDELGRITVTGEWGAYSASENSGYFAARFLSGGAPDPSFGSNGMATIAVSGVAVSSNLLVQQDGKLILGGYSLCTSLCPTDGYVNMVVARLLPNGALDNSFNGGRIIVEYLFHTPASPSFGWVDVGGTLAMQGTKIIVGGLARYQGSTRALLVRLNNAVGEAGSTQYVAIPALIQAEAYTNHSNTQLETTTDTGGGQNVGYIDNGDWLDYAIQVPATGIYTVSFRVASQMSGAQFGLYSNTGQQLANISVPNTGGWQSWTTITASVNLSSGQQVLRLLAHSGNWNINWLQFASNTNPNPITYVPIPATIEAENFTAQMGVQPEATSDSGGGQNIGYIDQGDWLEYTIHVNAAGSFQLSLRVASQMSGAALELRSSTGAVLASFTVPNTGNWQNWITLTSNLTLPAGDQTVRLISTAAAGWNINWLRFTQNTNPSPVYVTIPGKIEAENYLAQNGTQTEGTTDSGGGQNLGYIDLNDWMEYGINVPVAGNYTLRLRVATEMQGAQVGIRNASGLLATAAISNTGGWQNWQTIEVQVTLPQGEQLIRLVSQNSSNWNLNWIEFTSGVTPPPTNYVTLPAKIEAENALVLQGVQVENTADIGGGQNVGYIDQNDYLELGVVSPAAGSYTVSFRVASQSGGGLFAVQREDGTNLELIMVPGTGGWQNWVTVKATITLPAGTQRLRLVSVGTGNWNINWVSFAYPLNPEPQPGYTVIPAKVEAEDADIFYGVGIEQTSDTGGGQNVGYIDQWDYLNLAITPQVGTSAYLLTFRVASQMSGATFEVRNETGTVLATVAVPNTGGWQNWVNVTAMVSLQPINQRLLLLSTGAANWNLNWVDFSLPPAAITQKNPFADVPEVQQEQRTVPIRIFPNPVSSELQFEFESKIEGRLQADVIGQNGVVVLSTNFQKPAGKFRGRLSLSQLKPGQYYLRLQVGGTTKVEKFIRQ